MVNLFKEFKNSHTHIPVKILNRRSALHWQSIYYIKKPNQQNFFILLWSAAATTTLKFTLKNASNLFHFSRGKDNFTGTVKKIPEYFIGLTRTDALDFLYRQP